ncbi:hypothetical protein ACT42A_19050 (plasmid) [Acinetobacter baumannii]
MGNDGKKKGQSLDGYKNQQLPTVGTEVKIREALIESMIFYKFDVNDVNKVAKFTFHIEEKGFLDLEGRNKKSNNPPKNDPDFVKKSQLAIEYKLFHYHIGIPFYTESPSGDLTSDYVLQYSYDQQNGYVDIINVEYHPLVLPSKEDLESEHIENPFKEN